MARFVERATDDVAHADLAVTSAVANLRRDLDGVEKAIREGVRVSGSVSGSSFAESTARDLVKALADRDAACKNLALLEAVARESA